MPKMRNALLSTVSAAALTVSCAAYAGDRVPPGMNWTGFYLGGHAGYGWTEFTSGGATTSSDIDGFAGGLLAGYNYQMHNWVIGVEGDWTSTAWKSSPFSVTPKSSAQGRYTDMVSVRGRLGYAFDRTLVFGTVGWGRGEGSYADTKNKIISDFSHSGTVFGGGVEYKLSRNVSVGIEGLFYEAGFSKTVLSPSAKKSTTFTGDDMSVVRARLSVQF